jgi:hypothetical protein
VKFLKSFGQFWYDFIIGDDWKIAVGVVLALALAVLAMKTNTLSDQLVALAGGGAVVGAFAISLAVDVRPAADTRSARVGEKSHRRLGHRKASDHSP